MSRPRFSIAGLMGLVVVVAVGVAALRSGSEDWAGIVLTLTLGLLGAAVLGAIYRTGPRRAFWVGFALFGWGYLALTYAPWFGSEVGPRLATTRGLDLLFARLHPQQPQAAWVTGSVTPYQFYNASPNSPATTLNQYLVAGSPAGTTTTNATGSPPGATWQAATPTTGGTWQAASQPAGLIFWASPPDPEPFRRIGHGLFALLAAWIGGRLARYFAAGREPVAA